MISLILTILCSTTITLLLKHNDARKGNALILLTGNYFVAGIIGGLFLAFSSDAAFSLETLVFGAILAFMFVYAFFLFTKAVTVAGAALSAVSSRLSVVVPILLSILFFKEHPNINQVGGFLFAFFTILLFYFSLNRASDGHLRKLDYFYLLALLLGIGLNDFCMKIFNEWRPASEKPLFLTSIFAFSFLYTFSYSVLKKLPFDRSTMSLGAILGIPNVFSSFFLLGALAELPGILVYPTVNIGIIVLTTIAAILIWKEKVNTFGRFALLCGVIAIFLLSANN